MKNEAATRNIKATFTLKTTNGIEKFEPVDGSWTAEYDSETQTCFDAIPVIETAIGKQFNFEVKVQIFHSNGHEINNNSNEVRSGLMLVTRR